LLPLFIEIILLVLTTLARLRKDPQRLAA